MRYDRCEIKASKRSPQGDFDSLVSHVHPNIVVTVENGQVVRGAGGLRKFYEETLIAQDSPLERFAVTDFEVDELSVLHGDDTTIAFGSARLQASSRWL